MSGGAGSADRETSLSQVAALPPGTATRWSRRAWTRMLLALAPIVIVGVIGLIVALL